MITKLLLAHKNKLVFAAVFYTLVLTYLCLETIITPLKTISQSDKLMHALAYFVFTTSWFVALYGYFKTNLKKIYVSVFILSLVYGIFIEFLQDYCTLNRQGDFKDVLANILGTFIALLIIRLVTNKTVKS